MTSYASTWLDVGALPMRRRDVLALRLALECMRQDAHPLDPNDMLRSLGGSVANAIGEAAHEAWEHFADDRAWHTGRLPGNGDRLLRARLALALRCLLRVDAGDYGPRWEVCPDCGSDSRRPCMTVAERRCASRKAAIVHRSIVPLWARRDGGGAAR